MRKKVVLALRQANLIQSMLVRHTQFHDATHTLRAAAGHFNLAIRLADSLRPQQTLKLRAKPSLHVVSSARDPAPRSVQLDKAAEGAVDLRADGEGRYSVTSDHPLAPAGAHEDTCGFGTCTLARKLTLAGAHARKVEFSVPCAVRVKRDDGALTVSRMRPVAPEKSRRPRNCLFQS